MRIVDDYSVWLSSMFDGLFDGAECMIPTISDAELRGFVPSKGNEAAAKDLLAMIFKAGYMLKMSSKKSRAKKSGRGYGTVRGLAWRLNNLQGIKFIKKPGKCGGGVIKYYYLAVNP